MKTFAVMSLLSMVFLLSCHRKAVDQTNPSLSEISSDAPAESIPRDTFPATDIQPALAEVPLYVVAELQRSDCFGGCAMYEARIFSDGRAEYQGHKNVEWIGRFTAKIPPERLQEIYLIADRIDYFALSGQYPNSGRVIPEFQLTTTYLRRDHLEKRIENHFDAPRALLEFENWLEAFFWQLPWEALPNE